MKDPLELISSCVVKVITAGGSGSGLYPKSAHIVITNHHVVIGSRSAVIQLQNKKRFPAQVVFVDPSSDLAFLHLGADLDLPKLTLHEGPTVVAGMHTYVLGFPFGRPFTTTKGIVSSPDQVLEGKKYIQTDAAVNLGNSGGPLVDEKGNLTGITTSKFKPAENMSFALPVEKVQEALEIFKTNKEFKYCVKCPSCPTLLFEEVQYCGNCGHKIKIDECFAEQPLSTFAEFVEEAITQAGFDPTMTRNGYEYWEFYSGKVVVYISVYEQHYLCVSTPLTKIATKKISEFYQYILSNPYPPLYFGISDAYNNLYLGYLTAISDTTNQKNRARIQGHIREFIEKAPQIQKYLMDTFGCEETEEAKIPETT